jgi:hypothetical protein
VRTISVLLAFAATLFIAASTLAPRTAYAAGGACPSSAQYINPSNPTGPLVTLASLGVTTCFYIAANGSDSNDGLSETSGHPWAHAPGMVNCTGVCKATTPAAGEGFIVRGGDIWHYFNGSPQVGLPAGWPTGASAYAWDWQWSGTSAAEIYIGVDKTWFSGAAWARPILSNDNPTFLPSAPDPSTPSTFAVASCAYPQGNLDNFVFNGVEYAQLDNFEFTGMCWNDSVKSDGSNDHNYIKHFGRGPSYLVSFRTFSNMYWHGWSHTAFTPATCAAGSGSPRVCSGPGAVGGNTQATDQGTLIVFNVCDGSDSDDLTWTCVAGDAYDTEENVFRHKGGTDILDNCHSIHDNLWEYINNSPDGATHTDMWFCVSEYAADSFYYNNLVRYVGTEYDQPALSSVFWFAPQAGFTDYIYNNVGHDVNCEGDCNNFSDNGHAVSAKIFNNTWASEQGIQFWRNNNGPNFTFTDANNHYITSLAAGCAAAYVTPSTVNGGSPSCSGDVFQTIAEANAQGYTSENDFAPTATSTATIGTGANETGNGAAFGPAFLKSTTKGCTYNTTTHAVECPAVTANPRPHGGPWDVGAYQHCGVGGCTTPDAGAMDSGSAGLDAGVLDARVPDAGVRDARMAEGGSSNHPDATTFDSGGGVGDGRDGGQSSEAPGASSGCGCRVAGERSDSRGWLAILVFLVQGGFVLLRQRSRRTTHV